jgi:hypothetical protein
MPEGSVLDRLGARHHKILDMYLAGHTTKEISTALEMSGTNISTICNSPSFQHELALRRSQVSDLRNHQIAGELDDAARIMRASAAAAAGRLVKGLLTSTNEAESRKCATEILDRTGNSKINKTSLDITGTIVIDDETAQLLRSTLELETRQIVPSEVVVP